ncbi:hypothetical protein [Streptomyces sp. NPDC003832]
MPEFIISVTFSFGHTEHRCGNDDRHTRRVIAGLRGRYPRATIAVHSVIGTKNVTDDFAKRG